MKQILGLEYIRKQHPERLDANKLAEIVLSDLQHCRCRIYSRSGDDEEIVLAELDLLPETLVYDNFDQRIDLVVSGPIIRANHAPLTYRLKGNYFAINGRCSMIPRVCGVDLYLQHSYSGVVGDIARQKFSILIKPLLKMLLDIVH